MAEAQNYAVTGDPLPPDGIAIYAQTEGDPPPHSGETSPPPDPLPDSGGSDTSGTTDTTTDTTTNTTTDIITDTSGYVEPIPDAPVAGTEGDPPPH